MTRLVCEIAEHLDTLLRTREVPDYPGALNGLQVDHRGPVEGIAVAVDVSRRTIEDAARRGANLLVVHHGLFWGGPQPLTGALFGRVRSLIEADMALYSSHLPLDAHPLLGNNALLASELGLTVTRQFARFQGAMIGVAGDADCTTESLVTAAGDLARRHGGTVRVSEMEPDRRTRRWAICAGAGASTDTLREARDAGVDTLIAGEGPHHTAVEAPESGLTVIYAGHYATETLGVHALGKHLAEEYGLPWSFVHAPTGL